MTTRYSKLGLITAIGVMAIGTALANTMANPMELTVTSGTGNNASFLYIGSPSTLGTTSTVLWYGSWKGWAINLAFGSTYSPAIDPYGLDLSSVTADCSTSSCAPLALAISQIGFTASTGMNGLMSYMSNTSKSASDVITQSAYVDYGNSYFGSSDSNAPMDFGGVYSQQASEIGNTFSVHGLNTGSTVGGGNQMGSPYSLTLVDYFCSSPYTSATSGMNSSCSGNLSFSSDGQVTSASEPGALAIFGAGLLGCALFINRRRRAANRS